MRKAKQTRVPLDLGGLSGRVDIFRISGGIKRDPAVDAWLAHPDELHSIARAWFERIRECGDSVVELMHDGCPVACVEDAPFAYVNAFTQHVNVGFFYGAFLDDPHGLLQGSGKRMLHVKLSAREPIDDAALNSLVAKAYLDIKARLAAERS